LPSCAHEWERVSPVSRSSDGIREPCLLTNDTTNALSDLDKALLKVEHIKTLDKGKEQMTDLQSVAVDSSLCKSNDSVIDCLGKINATVVDADGLQDVAVKAKRTLHGRSASESGIVKLSQCFSNLPEHVNVQRRYEQGTYYESYGCVFIFVYYVEKVST